MGLKGGSAALTPAQLETQKRSLELAANFYNKWLPVQSAFISQIHRDQGGLEEVQRGQASGSARTRGTQATNELLSRDTQTGARAGSGRYATAFQSGTDASASTSGAGLAGASAQAQGRYVQALQQGLSLTQQDQQQALSGLSVAGQAEAAEAGANQGHLNSTLAGVGKLGGLAVGALSNLSNNSEFLGAVTGGFLGPDKAQGIRSSYNQPPDENFGGVT